MVVSVWETQTIFCFSYFFLFVKLIDFMILQLLGYLMNFVWVTQWGQTRYSVIMINYSFSLFFFFYLQKKVMFLVETSLLHMPTNFKDTILDYFFKFLNFFTVFQLIKGLPFSILEFVGFFLFRLYTVFFY